MMKFVKLNTGISMPIVGFGTYLIRGTESVHKALDAALASGYRAIDTAGVYRNEEDIGKALKDLLPKHGLKRQDLFITSKLAPKFQGKGKAREACIKSMIDLDVDYLDLYLIHWPGTNGMKPEDAENKILRHESWKDLEGLYKEGKLKNIGVSNYMIPHLEDLLESCSIRPTLLQIEHHPQLNQTELKSFCETHEIFYQAYSSLGTSTEEKRNQLLTDPVVTEVAKKYDRTAPQILLKWAVQQNTGVIPKSTNPKHIKENIELFDFEIDSVDMDKLNELNTGIHLCWDPSKVS